MIHSPHNFHAHPPAQFDGVFHWDFLRPAFHRPELPLNKQIAPMDFDGVVERNGFFLVFETKDPGVFVPQGQIRTLDRLTDSHQFTVVFCHKRPDQIDGWVVLTQEGRTQHRGDAQALVRWCRQWFFSANHGRRWLCR